METIQNYNADNRLFFGYVYSLMIGLMAIAGQLLAPGFEIQGLDLIDSFFIYLLLAQFVHLGWIHLGLNLAGLALITWGFSLQRSNLEWAGVLLISLLWLPLYLATVEPLDWYCGLSGALHFQFAASLLLAMRRARGGLKSTWPLLLMAAGLFSKLLMEWNTAPETDEMIGGLVAYEAHRGGALGGLLLGLLMIGYETSRRQTHKHDLNA